MKNLSQASSEVSKAALEPRCPAGHELAWGEEFCPACFNALVARAPLHILGIGLVTSLLTVSAGFVLSGIGSPSLGPVSHPMIFMVLGVGMALLGLGNAVLFRLTITEMDTLPSKTKKDNYPRFIFCAKCGSSMRNGGCLICTRRRRLRSEAIGFSWLPAVIVGTMVLYAAFELRSLVACSAVTIGILFPYIAYANWLSRKLPKFPEIPFLS